MRLHRLICRLWPLLLGSLVVQTSCGGLAEHEICDDCEGLELDPASEPMDVSIPTEGAPASSPSTDNPSITTGTPPRRATGEGTGGDAGVKPTSSGGQPALEGTGGKSSSEGTGGGSVSKGSGGAPPANGTGGSTAQGTGGAPPNGSGGSPAQGTGGAPSNGTGGSPPITPCQPSEEICDGRDNNCDGEVDELPWCGTCADAVFADTSYVFCSARLSHADAAEQCDSWGLSLSTPSNEAENDWLQQTGNQLFSSKFWIGFDDRETEGIWLSPEGLEPSFTNWHPGEPNNSGGNEHCVQLNRFWPNGTWNDEPCQTPLPYSCEPKAPPPPCEYEEISLDVSFDTNNPAISSEAFNTEGLVFAGDADFIGLEVGDGNWANTYGEERQANQGDVSLLLNPGGTGTYQTFYNRGGGALRGSVIYVRRSGELATSPQLQFAFIGLPPNALFDLVIFGQAQGQTTQAVNPTDMVVAGFDAGNGVGESVTLDIEGDGNFVGIRSSDEGNVEGFVTYRNEYGAISGMQLRSRSECD